MKSEICFIVVDCGDGSKKQSLETILRRRRELETTEKRSRREKFEPLHYRDTFEVTNNLFRKCFVT